MAIVSRAQEADVSGAVIAAHAEGMAVMELQPVPLGAATALPVDEATAVLVALAHSAAHGSRDVARRGRGVGV
jgi:hypothetical protein